MPGHRIPEDERREALLRAAYLVAARHGLAGVTGRAVAAEAGVSSGLVFFHFKTRDALLAALLDWLLAHTLVAAELPDERVPRAARAGSPAERMLAIVRRDLEALPLASGRVELFFEYWVLGTRDPAIRQTIRLALERYRASFVPLARAVVHEAPWRYGGLEAAEGLATVAATFVEGCALRAVLDPAAFDAERAMATLAALLRVPVAASADARPGVPPR